jgi:hypothetical protein
LNEEEWKEKMMGRRYNEGRYDYYKGYMKERFI